MSQHAADWKTTKEFAEIMNRSVYTLYGLAKKPNGHPACRWVEGIGLRWSKTLWDKHVSNSPSVKPKAVPRAKGRRPRFNGAQA